MKYVNEFWNPVDQNTKITSLDCITASAYCLSLANQKMRLVYSSKKRIKNRSSKYLFCTFAKNVHSLYKVTSCIKEDLCRIRLLQV